MTHVMNRVVWLAAVACACACTTTAPLPPPPQLEAAAPTDAEVEAWLWRTLDGVVQREVLARPQATWKEMQALTAIPSDEDLAHGDGALWSMMAACEMNTESCRLTPRQQQWVRALQAGAVYWCEGDSITCPVERAASETHAIAVMWSAFRRALERDAQHEAARIAALVAEELQLPRWLEVLAPITDDVFQWCLAATMPGTTDAIIATAARLNACPPDGVDLLTIALQRHPYDPELLMMKLERVSADDADTAATARSQLLALAGDDLAVVEQLAVHATKREEWIAAIELWQHHRRQRGQEGAAPPAQVEMWQRLQLEDQATSGKLDRVRRRIEESARAMKTTIKPGAFPTRHQLRITMDKDGKTSAIVVVDDQGKPVHRGDVRLAHIVARWWRARLAPAVPEGQTLVVQVELP